LNENISEEKVREVFSQFGNITEIILSKNHKNSKRKDLGFVTFNSHFEAKLALEAIKNNNYFDSPVNVSLSFSQQVMQAKKRIKDNRRKGNNNQQVSSLLGVNFNNNLGNLSDLVKNNQINQNVLNSIISMISANKNVNPTIMAQMMAVAVGKFVLIFRHDIKPEQV
jgi:CUG-BP- and ETR3-like factor